MTEQTELPHPRLPIIAKALHAALKSDTRNVVKIGGLLADAKELLTKHGTWLPWLRENFGMSERTAQNYMVAHRVATKYATVANLKLRPGALYAMAEMEHAEIVKILRAAKRMIGWIDRERAIEIAQGTRREREEAAEHQRAAEDRRAADVEHEAAEREAEAVLDGPPPELPPTGSPPPKPRDAARFEALADAVAAILSLRTLSAEKLAESAISADDFETAATLLTQIAEIKRRSRAA